MLDSPLLTIQVLLPYTRCGGRTAVSNVHYHGDARRRWQFTVPAFQRSSGCTRGSVLNRLITHQGRRGA